MNIEELKIKTYSTSIKSLPDHPSDEGYTADMLREAFDARSDNEIKNSHNALVDALREHAEDAGNPHNVTKGQLGLSNVDNTSDEDKPMSRAVAAEITAHTGNTANPHNVTKGQVGLSNVDNTSDMDKPVSRAVAAEITAHTGNTENPHSVTKSQLGLSDVDNTSDMDKPMSRAVTEALSEYVKNSDTATTEKAGVIRIATIPEAAMGYDNDAALTPYLINAVLEGRIPSFTNQSIGMEMDEYQMSFPASAGAVWDYVEGKGFARRDVVATQEETGVVRFATSDEVASFVPIAVAMTPADFEYALSMKMLNLIDDEAPPFILDRPVSGTAVKAYVESALADILQRIEALEK